MDERSTAQGWSGFLAARHLRPALFTQETTQDLLFYSRPTGPQYLEVPLEGRVGDGVDLKKIFLLVAVPDQHHGVNEGVDGRQLGVWRRNKQHSMFAQYLSVEKKHCVL